MILHRYQINFKVDNIFLDVKFPCSVRLHWRRGKKYSETSFVVLNKGSASSDQLLSLYLNMQPRQSLGFKSKRTIFTLYIQTESGIKLAGTANFDPSYYVQKSTSEAITIKLQHCPDKTARITGSISSKFVVDLDESKISKDSGEGPQISTAPRTIPKVQNLMSIPKSKQTLVLPPKLLTQSKSLVFPVQDSREGRNTIETSQFLQKVNTQSHSLPKLNFQSNKKKIYFQHNEDHAVNGFKISSFPSPPPRSLIQPASNSMRRSADNKTVQVLKQNYQLRPAAADNKINELKNSNIFKNNQLLQPCQSSQIMYSELQCLRERNIMLMNSLNQRTSGRAQSFDGEKEMLLKQRQVHKLRIQNLEKQLLIKQNELNSKVSASESDIRQMKNLIGSKERRINEVQEQLLRVSAERKGQANQHLAKEVQENKINLKRLQVREQLYKQEIQKMSQNLKRVQREHVDQLSKAKMDRQQLIRINQQAVSKLQQSSKLSQIRLTEKQIQCNTVKAQLQFVRMQLQSHLQSSSEQNQRIMVLQQQLSRSSFNYSQLREQKANLSHQLQMSTLFTEEKGRAYQQLNKQYTELQRLFNSLQSKYQLLESQNHQLRQSFQLQSARQQNERILLSKKLENQTEATNRFKQNVSTAVQSLFTVTQNREVGKPWLEGWQNLRWAQVLRSRWAQQSQQLRKAKEQKIVFVSQELGLKAQLLTLKQEKDSLLNKQSQIVSQFQNQLNQCVLVNQQLKNEYNQLVTHLQQAQMQFKSQLNVSKEQLQSKTNQLDLSMRKSEEQTALLTTEIRQLSQENHQLHLKNKQTSQLIQQMSSQHHQRIQKLTQEQLSLKQKLQTLEHSYSQLKLTCSSFHQQKLNVQSSLKHLEAEYNKAILQNNQLSEFKMKSTAQTILRQHHLEQLQQKCSLLENQLDSKNRLLQGRLQQLQLLRQQVSSQETASYGKQECWRLRSEVSRLQRQVGELQLQVYQYSSRENFIALRQAQIQRRN